MMRRRPSAAATVSPDTAVAIARTVPSSAPILAARFRDQQGRDPLRLIDGIWPGPAFAVEGVRR
ncbi:hypothetical protein BZG35_14640 [Brevundimonas sp. LM2]|nr:hypothetical protein BZG35_14640 [Brevundimonas sp. LM2]